MTVGLRWSSWLAGGGDRWCSWWREAETLLVGEGEAIGQLGRRAASSMLRVVGMVLGGSGWRWVGRGTVEMER